MYLSALTYILGILILVGAVFGMFWLVVVELERNHAEKTRWAKVAKAGKS